MKAVFEKDWKINVVRINVSTEVDHIIKNLSSTLKLSISSIFREILDVYKNKAEIISKMDEEDYSKRLLIRLRHGCSTEEYEKYADKISNQDIINILKEIYNI